MNQIVKAKSTPQLPANILEDLNAEVLAMKDRIGALSGDNIFVTRNKTFKMPGSDTEAPEITAVIIDWVTVNKYYPGKFDPKNIQPPVCVAIGQKEKELVPFADSPKKQSDDCASCPQNQFGSDGRGKACKNQRLLALLPPNDQAEGPLMLLNVSPTAIRHFDAYVNKITNSGIQVPHPIAVVTTVFFDAASEYPSLRFRIEAPNDQIAVAYARRKEALSRLLTPPTFPVPVTP